MLSAVLLAGCAGGPVRLSDEALMQRASAGPLTVREARVITDNDAAFQSKLKLVERAKESVAGIIADPKRSVRLDEYYFNTPREQILEEDLIILRKILAKYKIDKRLEPAQEKLLETRFRDLLTSAYELTRDSLAKSGSEKQRRGSQDRFNEAFKPI